MDNLYSILDTVAEEFSAPYVAKNDGIAIRMYHQTLSKVDPNLKPEFKLYKLGSWDSVIGTIVSSIPHLLTPFESVIKPIKDLTEN